MDLKPYRPLLHVALGCAVAAAVIASVWWPEFHVFRVATHAPTASEIATSSQPLPAAVVDNAWQVDFLLVRPTTEAVMEQRARLLIHEAAAARARSASGSAFAAGDLEAGGSSSQLGYAGWAGPDTLLHAYRSSHDLRFLDAAIEEILRFSEFEAHALWQRGYVWNDHAVANRALVLCRLWTLYGALPDRPAAERRALLAAVERTGAMLAAPLQFNARTNHGAMQNIALLTLAVTFPGLADAPAWRETGFGRLSRQLRYYISDEGVVLEHSAGYHTFGTELLEDAVREVTLLGMPVPASWTSKLADAKEFSGRLARPDGTVPLFGNSTLEMAGGAAAAPATAEGDGVWLYPVSGYAIWWRSDAAPGPRTQLVAGWSNFDTRAHKHADELGLQFWEGQPWWTASGYWPYDDSRLPDAISWRGSNAPHLADEDSKSVRNARLVASAFAADAAFMQMTRTGPGQLAFDRQILTCGDRWVVVDTARGAPASAALEVVWTTTPEVRVAPAAADRSYTLKAPAQASTLGVSVAGRAGPPEALVTSAQSHPFAGWIAQRESVPEATTSLVVSVPANDPLVTAWHLRANGAAASEALRVVVEHWSGVEEWAVTIADGSATLAVSRRGDTVDCHRAERPGADTALHLTAGPDVVAPKAAINAAYAALTGEFPIYRYLVPWRRAATHWLLAGLLAQETLALAALALLARGGAARARIRLAWGLRLALVLAWVCVAVVLNRYFAA